jgi:flagellar assembly protein FliH
MTSTSASPLPTSLRHEVLRREDAATVTAADFRTDLRGRTATAAESNAQRRAEAQAAGYAAGWAQGRREAEESLATEHERLLAEARRAAAAQASTVDSAVRALASAALRLEQRTAPVAAEIEAAVLATAFAIAEAVVGRELATAAEPGRDALARVLALAPDNRPVTVRLNPADHATVGQSTVDIDGRSVTLVADPALSPGDATATCDATAIDGRLSAALDRVREALGL